MDSYCSRVKMVGELLLKVSCLFRSKRERSPTWGIEW